METKRVYIHKSEGPAYILKASRCLEGMSGRDLLVILTLNL